MERLVYDIDAKIEFNRNELAMGLDMSDKARWNIERTTAGMVFQRDVKAHYEAQGAEFFDHRQWQLDGFYAQCLYREAAKRYRKRQGDRQILARLDELRGTSAEEGGYKVTEARRKVIRALVGLASSSGVLYCGYDGLAREARVSPRSACTIRSELERLGVLERIRTGGISEGGARQSNKYIVMWDALREALGIPSAYASEWRVRHPRTVERSVFRNVYYNYEGFAHYSRSARQKRRERQRAREHARAVMERARRAYVENAAAVENPRPDGGPQVVENPENDRCEQGFCALTTLKELKTSKIFQPARSFLSYCRRIVEKRTPLRGSLNARPEDGMPESLRDALASRPAGGPTWCFDVNAFSPTSQRRLGRVAPERILPLLNEIDQMTRQSTSVETLQDMQEHAEAVLHLLADADRSLFTPQAPDRIGAAAPRGSEK